MQRGATQVSRGNGDRLRSLLSAQAHGRPVEQPIRRPVGPDRAVATDRGTLVLLDNRITKQRYGQVFFDSLPDYGFTTNLRDVEKFFDV